MNWLPRSLKARRRLLAVAVAAPVLAGAVGLSLYAMEDAVVFFYGPADLVRDPVAPGRTIRIGGLVEEASLVRAPDGAVRFAVTDGAARTDVNYSGDLPDLFREGQGVVVEGAFDESGDFTANQVLAKHDETYMPREVADALKANGHWQDAAAN